MPNQVIAQTIRGAASLAVLAVFTAPPAAQAVPRRGHCAARITGAFADSCRDFAAHSSKDISYVELHYVGGSVVRQERIGRHDFAVDGEPGDEIDFARVKSGRTTEEFACVPSNAAPSALLEVETPPFDQTPEHCNDFFPGELRCEQSSPRTAWTSTAQVPDQASGDPGALVWGCGGLTDFSLCRWTFTFRGIRSSDVNGDIASWSLDFGDGTAMSGTWSAPPTGVPHEYVPAPSGDICGSAFRTCIVTLTITDSAGQSDSDTVRMVFLDQRPD